MSRRQSGRQQLLVARHSVATHPPRPPAATSTPASCLPSSWPPSLSQRRVPPRQALPVCLQPPALPIGFLTLLKKVATSSGPRRSFSVTIRSADGAGRVRATGWEAHVSWEKQRAAGQSQSRYEMLAGPGRAGPGRTGQDMRQACCTSDRQRIGATHTPPTCMLHYIIRQQRLERLSTAVEVGVCSSEKV